MEYDRLKDVPAIKSGCIVMKREQRGEDYIRFTYFACANALAKWLVEEYSWHDYFDENSEVYTIIRTVEDGDPNGIDYNDPTKEFPFPC